MQRKQTNDVASYFEEFILEKQHQGLEAVTIKDYRQAYDEFIRRTDGELNKDSIYQLIDYHQQAGSEKCINFYLTHLRVFFNFCYKQGYIEKVDIKLLKQQKEKIVYYTKEECIKLLKKPASNASFREWRTYTMICFMLATGARMGTLVEIKLQDIDLENSEITYRHLKTKELAVIPLSSTLVYTIRNYLKTWDIKEFLFCDYDNKQMSKNSVRLSIERYCEKRGVDCKGTHAFRHTFAREWILNGGNAFALQQMMCHKDLTMTKRYCNIFGKDLHNDVAAFSPLEAFAEKKVKKI